MAGHRVLAGVLPVIQTPYTAAGEIGGRARAFEGSGGAAIVDSFRRGIVGTMSGAEVCWAIRRLWDAVNNGDWDLAYDISGPLMLLVSMQTTIDGYVAIEKHLLKRQGVIRETFQRDPRGYQLDPESEAEADRLFDRLVAAVEESGARSPY